MKGKKFWRRVADLSLLILVFVFFMLPKCHAETYSIGIVGIDSRIKDKDLNLGDYTDLTQLENPLSYAQKIFEEVMTTDLPTIGLNAVDKTAQATSTRIAEVNFQLDYYNTLI